MKKYAAIVFIIAILPLLACTETKTQTEEFIAPDWAKGVVWYQIFPERFRDGDLDNQPGRERANGPEDWEITKWTQQWYKQDEWEKNLGDDFYNGVFERRYGGDLQGIIDKLDYLKELGVGGIYLNPIFDAQSLHKYDASYYHHIDRNFGPNPDGDLKLMESENPNDPSTWEWTEADKLFLKLIEEVHKRDMKIIIDGVFNHTGRDFWAFKDIIEHQKESKYKDWYSILEFDDPQTEEDEFDYEGWWGYKGLPEFKQENGNLVNQVKQHIFEITRRWMDPYGNGDTSLGVDGWRLDVAEEVGDPFWIEWHKLVREINPEAITIAEIWTDNAKNYIRSDMFTGVMNYRFAYAAKDYFIDQRIDKKEFESRLNDVWDDYPEKSWDILQNLMDSHDTPRIASMIVNPGLEYDRDGSPKDGFDPRKPNAKEREIQKLVSIFQYTWKGAPMLYYGTEAGMWGADDPDDRKPMVWDDMVYEAETIHPLGEKRAKDENNFDLELHKFYSKLAATRNQNPSLQTGEVEFIEVKNEDLVVFKRTLPDENDIYIGLNRTDTSLVFKIKACEIEDLLENTPIKSQECEIDIKLEPISGKILKINSI